MFLESFARRVRPPMGPLNGRGTVTPVDGRRCPVRILWRLKFDTTHYRCTRTARRSRSIYHSYKLGASVYSGTYNGGASPELVVTLEATGRYRRFGLKQTVYSMAYRIVLIVFSVSGSSRFRSNVVVYADLSGTQSRH